MCSTNKTSGMGMGMGPPALQTRGDGMAAHFLALVRGPGGPEAGRGAVWTRGATRLLLPGQIPAAFQSGTGLSAGRRAPPARRWPCPAPTTSTTSTTKVSARIRTGRELTSGSRLHQAGVQMGFLWVLLLSQHPPRSQVMPTGTAAPTGRGRWLSASTRPGPITPNALCSSPPRAGAARR